MSGVAMVACPSRLTLIMTSPLNRMQMARHFLSSPPCAGTTVISVVPSSRSPLRLVRPDRDLELADLVALAAQHIARLDRAHALRRSGVINVARIERVERRRELDQAADVVDQVLGVGGLLEHA